MFQRGKTSDSLTRFYVYQRLSSDKHWLTILKRTVSPVPDFRQGQEDQDFAPLRETDSTALAVFFFLRNALSGTGKQFLQFTVGHVVFGE